MRQHATRFDVRAATVRPSPVSMWKADCSDVRTWTDDHVGNRRNNRYLSLGKEDESARTLPKTKHPASVIYLGFVTSNGAVMPLMWYPSEYRLTARDYEAKLADKLVSWINIFGILSVTVVLQQDGIPAHTSN